MLRFVMRLLQPCLVLFAASLAPVWAGQTPLHWVARHGLSAADYQKAFDEFGKDPEGAPGVGVEELGLVSLEQDLVLRLRHPGAGQPGGVGPDGHTTEATSVRLPAMLHDGFSSPPHSQVVKTPFATE